MWVHTCVRYSSYTPCCFHLEPYTTDHRAGAWGGTVVYTLLAQPLRSGRVRRGTTTSYLNLQIWERVAISIQNAKVDQRDGKISWSILHTFAVWHLRGTYFSLVGVILMMPWWDLQLFLARKFPKEVWSSLGLRPSTRDEYWWPCFLSLRILLPQRSCRNR